MGRPGCLFQLSMALENSLSIGLVLGTRNPLGVSVPFSLREARNLASAGGEQESSSLTSLPNLISPTPSLGSFSSRGILASTVGLLLLGSSWPQPLPFFLSTPSIPLWVSRISYFQISPFLTVPIIVSVAEFETLHIPTTVRPGLCLNPPKGNSQTLLRIKDLSFQPLLPFVLRRPINNTS